MTNPTRNSVGEVIAVGQIVDRLDHYKTNGKVVAINTKSPGRERAPILVRWSRLDDEWCSPELLMPRPGEVADLSRVLRRPTQKRSAEVLKRIEDAAREHLHDVGVCHFSTHIVAQMAGTSVGNLYRWFAVTEDLIEHIEPGATRPWIERDRIREVLVPVLDGYEAAVEKIEDEWGMSRTFPVLVAAGDEEAIAITQARAALGITAGREHDIRSTANSMLSPYTDKVCAACGGWPSDPYFPAYCTPLPEEYRAK